MFRVGDYVRIKGTPNGLPYRDYVIGCIGKITSFRGGVPLVEHKGDGDCPESWYYDKEALDSIHTEVFKAIKRHEALLKP